MLKQKSADANDLGVEDWKLRGIRSGIGWNILSTLMQLFAFLAAILIESWRKLSRKSVVNQLLQRMGIVIGSILLKRIEPSILAPKNT